jgi:hypothetical protein
LPRFFSRTQNALKQDWQPEQGFCDCPFARGSIPVWLACGFASGSQLLIAARPIEKPRLQEAAGRLGCNVLAIYHDERASVSQRLIIDGLSRETHTPKPIAARL